MGLTLCPTCRLPVNSKAERCALCTSSLKDGPPAKSIAAAALAVVATALALVARRRA